MKLVKESLSFERGQSPKFSMGVGKIAQINGWLDKMEVKNYTINDDFTIDVDGDVNLCYKNLEKFPEFIKFGKIEGYFSCSNNYLYSLKGAPKTVGRGFGCYSNRLTTLDGAPDTVGEDFNCSNNKLISLEGSTKSVGLGFYCAYNQLTSLDGAPESIGGGFYCKGNIKKFTREDVQKVCQVKGEIRV